MCIHQLTIPTNTRYISLSYHDRFLNQFACGKCCECQQLKSLQWSFRCNYEFDDLPDDGYVMFDCLSYSDCNLPHLSDFWPMLSKSEDFPCFNRKHIRNFLQTLRQRVIRAGYSPAQLRYYYACEYGTKPHCTHRPHIHLMLFCYGIPKKWLSATIADVWKFGRTDGLPYKTTHYVLTHNVVDKSNLTSRLRTIKYITKYLQKSCIFQSELDKRVARVMCRLAEYVTQDSVTQTPEDWLESEIARRERLKLLRYVNQYHRTSQQFGASALSCFDFDDLVKGNILMPNSGSVKIHVPLSTYYKRKLFYEKVEINGSVYYDLNDLGREYNSLRHEYIMRDTMSRLAAQCATSHIDTDLDELTDYVVNHRGFILSSSSKPSFSLVDRVKDCDFINYSTCADKLQFNQRGLTQEWLGDSQQGYTTDRLKNRITIKDFIGRYVYIDEEKEAILDKITHTYNAINSGKQSMHELRQRMQNLCKMLS